MPEKIVPVLCSFHRSSKEEGGSAALKVGLEAVLVTSPAADRRGSPGDWWRPLSFCNDLQGMLDVRKSLGKRGTGAGVSAAYGSDGRGFREKDQIILTLPRRWRHGTGHAILLRS